jgi:Ca2+-binding RTX toxin-like protein
MTNAAIFGRLFFDRNADNTENNGTGGFDFGVVGQTVQLVNASGVYVQSVVTDGTGAYHFLDIPPGNYFVQVPTAVGQATLVPKNVGGFAADSDANPGSGRTDILSLSAGEKKVEIDFGYRGFTNGVVEGAAAGESMPVGYVDGQGDVVTNNSDAIFGNGGNDTIRSGGGDDVVQGGAGNDLVDGGTGNDTIIGDGAGFGGSPNLLVNGSFEDVSGLGSNPFGRVGVGSIPGWTTSNPNSLIEVFNINPETNRAGSDGNFAVDMEGSPGNIRLGQNVQNIVTGQSYRLTFDVADSADLTASGPNENVVDVFFGGQLIATIDPSNVTEADYEKISLNIIGGSGDGSNRLEFQGRGIEDNIGISLDNVSLVPNLIVNGSFENVAGLTPQPPFGFFGTGSIQGWTTTGPNTRIEVFNFNPETNMAGSDGSFAIDMEGSPGNINLGQNVQGMVAGEVYNLTFDVADSQDLTSVDGPNENVVDVFFGGQFVATIDPSNTNEANYEPILLNIVGGAGDGSNRLEFRGRGVQDNIGISLDNVAVTPTTAAGIPGQTGGNDTLNGGDGNDLLDGGVGDDVLDGGAGNDRLFGGSGNDTLQGDSDAAGQTAATGTFRWSAIPDPNDGGQIDAGDVLSARTLTQTVNGTVVTVTLPNTLLSDFSTEDISTGGLPAGTNDFSSLRSVAQNAQAGTQTIAFSSPVNNVSFSLSDLGTGLDYVDIVAFDALGNRIPLDIIQGADLQVEQSGGIDLRVRELVQQFDGPNDPTAAATVNIPGPVSRITIAHVSVGGQLSFIYISDINFTTQAVPAVPGIGDDLLDGGDGNDFIDAGAGNDTALGGEGNDVLRGRDGNDFLDGGAGNDDILGEAGDDVLRGRAGNDFLAGGAGNDDILGEDGDDTIFGDTGNDFIGGGAGNDVIGDALAGFPEGGDDHYYGDTGNDSLHGGLGNDTLVGGAGADLIEGGAGNDVITFDNPFVTDEAPATDGAGDRVFGGTDGTLDNDVLDLRGAGAVTIGQEADPEDAGATRGTVTFANGGTLTFAGIETILRDNDGIVDGTDAAQSMLIGFEDAQGDTIDGADGLNDTILGNRGDDTINAGLGDDSVDGGQGADSILGGDGNDTLDGGTADGEADTILGNAGNDVLFGGTGGADVLFGGDNNDTLNGGLDADSLFGDAGDDVLYADQQFGGLSQEGADTLFGGDGNDTLFLNPNANLRGGEAFGGIGNDAIHGSGQGDLIDAGAGDDFVFAGAGNDTVRGGEGSDFIDAETGNDNVQGEGGDDTLRGRAGDDTVSGGEGNDDVMGEAGNDSVSGDGGNDFVSGGEGVDTLSGGDGNDTVSGGTEDDQVRGNAGNDTLIGGAGADLIEGGSGNDVITFDNPFVTDEAPATDGAGDRVFGGTDGTLDNDVLDLRGAGAVTIGQEADPEDAGATRGTVTFANGGTLTFAGIETILRDNDGIVDGTDAAQSMLIGFEDAQGDTIDGADGLNDTILGNRGDDTINAGLGDDSVDGGQGADSILGGDGNDTLDGGTADGEADTILGNAGNDVLFGGTGGADVLFGGDNNDTLNGGLDADSLFGDAGDDVLYADQQFGGLSQEGADTLFGGDGNDTLFLNPNANLRGGEAFGGIGNDAIHGSGQGDLIDAGAGDDFVFAGAGNDTVRGGEGSDFIDAETGNDNVQGEGGDDTLRGRAGDDTVSGGEGNDDVMGEAGNDSVSGDGGNDFVSGGEGVDTLSGGDGNDTVSGGTEDDQVRGNAGNDTLIGGAGADLIEGGSGNDVITFDNPFVTDEAPATDGAGDRVFGGTDGTLDNDVLDLRGAGAVTIGQEADPEDAGATRGTVTFANGGTLTFAGIETILRDNDGIVDGADAAQNMPIGFEDAQGDTIDGADGLNDSIRGNAGNDTIDAGLGDDSVDGGQGADSILGGAGNDTLDGGTADGEADTILGNAGNDVLFGGTGGADVLFGGDNNDTLNGGLDADSLFGDAGDDVLYADQQFGGLSQEGADTLFGGDGNDRIFLNPNANLRGGEAFGGAGNDVINGSAQGDLIDGDAGDDSVIAGAGNDTARGGEGNDTIDGGLGNDQILGGTGNDQINGGAGDDVTYGDNALGLGSLTVAQQIADQDGAGGNDTFTGSLGADQSWGEGGNDTIIIGSAANGAGDVVVGGNGPNPNTDNDVLDLRGAGPVVITATADATDAGALQGTVQFADGSTLQFFQIETILRDNDGVVDGTAGNDVITPTSGPGGTPFTDADGDQVDGGDGVNDTIAAGAGNDVVDAGAGNDTVFGGTGNDSLTGGAGTDSVSGEAGSDTLAGGAGADRLFGGQGDDDIAVGGADTAEGGSGDDVFILDGTDTAADINATVDGGSDGTSGAPDDAANGNAGDVLDLSAGTTGQLVTFGVNPETGTVNGLDADVGTDLTFAEIERVLTGSGNDTINGGGAAGPIVVDTGSGNDTVTGGSGNDSVNAGAGDDTVNGGAGDDSVAGGSGNDLLDGGANDDTLQGNDGADTLIGGAGNDSLDGGADDDSLTGNDGNDTLNGGAGADTLDGGANDDVLNGGDNADSVTGGSGNDILSGDAGDDTLDGGQGNDSVAGGTGNDSLTGGDGNDTLSGGEGADTLQGGAGTDSLLGGDGDDDIIVGAGDTARGGAGDDEFTIDPTLVGAAGITVVGGEELEEADIDPTNNPSGRIGDVLDLRGLTDVTVVYNNPDPISGTSENGTATYRNAAGQLVTITFSEIETVLSSADGIVDGTGGGDLMTPTSGPGGTPFTDPQGDQIDGSDGLNDIVMAGGGNDTVDAGLGNDTVDGGTGNDVLSGGAGDDSLIGNSGADTLNGDAGNDVLDGGLSDDSLTGGTGNDTLLGGEGRDTLAGGANDDSLTGGADDDSLSGNEGRDTLIGGAGNDTLDGGDEADVLNGNEGADSILGGAGNDSIDAGSEADVVFGGAGNDAIIAGAGDDTVDGGANDDTIAGGDGFDALSGGDGADSLLGDAGNDTLDGGAGNDTLSGGDGSDLITGGEGADSILGGAGDDDLIIGAGDRAEGGDGDDEFRVNPALAGAAAITVIGGELGEDTTDPTNGGAGDVLDLRGLSNVTVSFSGAESGTATYLNGANAPVTITFSEIERVLVDSNGVVDGTAAGDLMTPTSGAGGTPFADAQGDQIDGTDGLNDTVAAGQGNDTVDAGQGDDTVDGGSGDDILSGNVGNDSLIGGEGDDTLAGDVGADTLDGGEGADSLAGGDGADSLVGGEGRDTLLGGEGRDTLLGGNEADSLAGGAGDDSLVGGAGADTLEGGAGADSVTGDAGDDDIIVGGADTASGGTGDDVFTADASDPNTAATIFGGSDGTDGAPDDAANGNAGDLLDLSAGTTPQLVNFDTNPENGTVNGLDVDAGIDLTFAEIERVLTGSAGDTVLGAGSTGVINIGTGAGNDTITAGAGNDLIDAGADDDVVNANAGNDSVNAGAGNDTVDAGAGNDTVDGGAGNDSVLGQSGADLLQGGDGNDTLNGGADNDTLLGGLNDDLLIGGDGRDVLNGNEGRDTLQGGVGDDTLDGGDEADSLQGGSGNDLIQGGNGADIAEGNEGNDTLEGAEGADTLFGNEGDDLLRGGDGNDSLVGGEGSDSVIGGEGDDFINTRNTQAIPDEAGVLSDPNPNDDRDTVEGGVGNDTILTGDDADLVFGGDGNDSINAGLDDDTVFGGANNDTIIGDEGDDLIDGGDGDDLLYGGSDTITPADQPNNGSDPLPANNEDTITGGEGNDTIFGFDDNDSLSGDAGNDALFGGLDDDTLNGGDGNDSLSGDEGNDSLVGGAGNDTLQGGAGRDRLAGGAGADLLVGGLGADLFTTNGADTIADFDATTGIQGTVGAATDDNDFIDLSALYNETTLAAFNAANPGSRFDNPLEWLRADQADGVLQGASGLRIQNNGTAVAGDLLNLENTGVVCFVRGTSILTVAGEKPIEELVAGDLIMTLDHGYQPIRWIGSSIVEGKGRFAPIVIEAGTLGNARRLAVSPQHRMLLSGWQAELYFDEPEVLVAAKLLVNDMTIRAQEQAEVEYFHMLFDTHEIVYAEGAASESFHPGHVGWGALAEAAREEILSLFPQLEGLDFSAYGPAARRSLTAKEARLARDTILSGDVNHAAE